MPVAAAGATLAGGMMGNSASHQATNELSASQDAANQTQWQALQQVRADNATRQQVENNALARLMEEMGFGVTDLGAQNAYSPTAGGNYVESQNSLHGPGASVDKLLGTSKALGPLGGIFGGQAADPLGLFGSAQTHKYWTPGGVQNTQRYTFNPQGNGTKIFSAFQADPGYQARLNEGNKAITNSFAARGGLLSGAAVKAAQKYASDMASQEYGNYMNRLANLAGLGSSGVNNITNATQNTSNSLANGITAGGNARASGYAAQGQNNANMVNSLANLYNQYRQNNGGGYNYSENLQY